MYNTPLPLDDFEGYDGYWEGRERGGKTTEILPRWKLAVEKIPDGASVLDVGCGSGGFLMYLREQRPNCRVRGTDISQHAVDLARERGLDAFQADLTVDKLDDDYDYITGFEMIEHVHEAEKVLVAMRDAMRRQLILSLPNTGYIEHRARLAVFGRFPNTQIKFHAKEHIRFWTVKDFRDWADHFDLDVVDIQGQWGLHFMPWRSRPATLLAADRVHPATTLTRGFSVDRWPSAGPLTSGFGGAEGIRTPDLLIANETRYQLRHSPMRPLSARKKLPPACPRSESASAWSSTCCDAVFRSLSAPYAACSASSNSA